MKNDDNNSIQIPVISESVPSTNVLALPAATSTNVISTILNTITLVSLTFHVAVQERQQTICKINLFKMPLNGEPSEEIKNQDTTMEKKPDDDEKE